MTRPDDPIKPLTPRQLEVAELLGRGWPYKRVATHLGITHDTVATHVTEISYRIPNPDALPPGALVMLWAIRHVFKGP